MAQGLGVSATKETKSHGISKERDVKSKSQTLFSATRPRHIQLLVEHIQIVTEHGPFALPDAGKSFFIREHISSLSVPSERFIVLHISTYTIDRKAVPRTKGTFQIFF